MLNTLSHSLLMMGAKGTYIVIGVSMIVGGVGGFGICRLFQKRFVKRRASAIIAYEKHGLKSQLDDQRTRNETLTKEIAEKAEQLAEYNRKRCEATIHAAKLMEALS